MSIPAATTAPLRAVDKPQDDTNSQPSTQGTDKGVRWEDPPLTSWGGARAGGIWLRLLTPLMERPGQWAHLRTCPVHSAYGTSASLTKRTYNIPPGRWEFCARSINKTTGSVYGRYLGPEEGK